MQHFLFNQTPINLFKQLSKQAGPKLLVLDEPTAGVDQASTEALVRTLADVRAAGRAMLVVTHDLAELGDVPDRAITLAGGREIGRASCRERVCQYV